MSEKQRLNSLLEAAAALRESGAFDAAEQTLVKIADDPEVAALGARTSLGLPRRLQSAMLRLAKRRGDAVRKIAFQYHLVPPPEQLAPFASFSLDERRAMADANRKPVPRTLHQIWIGARAVPPACSAWAKHAVAHGYDHKLWREDDLEKIGLNQNTAFAAMLERGDYPGAVDIARYQILEQQGGIYLDCDWYPGRTDVSFHDLLPMIGLTAFAEDIPRNTGKGSVLLANSFIATPAAHPVMSRMNAVIGDAMAAIPKGPAWWTTGPLLFTLIARAGSVTLADADFVTGNPPKGAREAEIMAMANDPATESLLIPWKSW